MFRAGKVEGDTREKVMDFWVVSTDYEIYKKRKVGVTKNQRTLCLFQGIWLYGADNFKHVHPPQTFVKCRVPTVGHLSSKFKVHGVGNFLPLLSRKIHDI